MKPLLSFAKTNGPVTDQPDWASVYIFYKGIKIDQAGLLKYIVFIDSIRIFTSNVLSKYSPILCQLVRQLSFGLCALYASRRA